MLRPEPGNGGVVVEDGVQEGAGVVVALPLRSVPQFMVHQRAIEGYQQLTHCAPGVAKKRVQGIILGAMNEGVLPYPIQNGELYMIEWHGHRLFLQGDLTTIIGYRRKPTTDELLPPERVLQAVERGEIQVERAARRDFRARFGGKASESEMGAWLGAVAGAEGSRLNLDELICGYRLYEPPLPDSPHGWWWSLSGNGKRARFLWRYELERAPVTVPSPRLSI